MTAKTEQTRLPAVELFGPGLPRRRVARTVALAVTELYAGVIGLIAGVLGLPVVNGGRRREAVEGPRTPEEIQATVDSCARWPSR